MPRAIIKQEEGLNAIAQELANKCNCTVCELIGDLMKMDSILAETHGFNWSNAGARICATKQQLYRWYHDTYQRKLFGSVNAEDMQIIRQQLEIALSSGREIGRDFQCIVKSKLSKEYHRNAFTVAFNNQKRMISLTNNQVLLRKTLFEPSFVVHDVQALSTASQSAVYQFEEEYNSFDMFQNLFE